MLPIAILAGGLATRLRPITENIPKSLIKVAGHPFIAWQLRKLHNEGFRKVIICTGFRGEMIEKVIGDGRHYGLTITYSHDGEKLLGTGGAIKKAMPLLGETFFILYGDSFLPICFSNIEKNFLSSNYLGLMTILKNNNKMDKSNVLFKGGSLIEYNKHKPLKNMSHIDYGLSILKSSCFSIYDCNQNFDLSDLYHTLSLKGQLQGYEVHSRFYEIGSFFGLKETEIFLANKGFKT